MDPITGAVLVLAGASAIGGLVVYERHVRRQRRTAWAMAAAAHELELSGSEQHPVLRGQIGAASVHASIYLERRGDHQITRTYVTARCVISDGPRYRVRRSGTQWSEAASELERIEIGDPEFDPAYLLATDEPRAFAFLFTPARRAALEALDPRMRLESDGAEVTIHWPGLATKSTPLVNAIGLAAELAGVGQELEALVREVDGIQEREEPTSEPRWLESFGPMFGLAAHRQTLAPRFELRAAGTRLELRLTYWRGLPGYRLDIPSARPLPRFALRWDEQGTRHGDAPPELTMLIGGRPPGGPALLKHDGTNLRLYARAPEAPSTIVDQASFMARLVGPSAPGGAFR